jgi:hypothetical protein
MSTRGNTTPIEKGLRKLLLTLLGFALVYAGLLLFGFEAQHRFWNYVRFIAGYCCLVGSWHAWEKAEE